MSGYYNEIKSLDKEIKRLNTQTRKLREQKKRAQSHLYEWMVAHDIEKYENISLKSIEPKDRRRQKPKKLRKNDAVQLFYQTGIPDPEGFWEEFQRTQKL